MNLPLDPHQLETIEFGLRQKYSILALDMGLGKTACALGIWDRAGRPPLLVACPAYLILNWFDEIRKWLGPDVIVDKIRKGSDIYYVFDTDIVLISYNLMQRAPQLFEWAQMVVADEAHELKTMTAKRTMFFHQHVYENSIKRLHLLTGTPIKNRVKEYYSLLALMYYNPKLGGESDFLDRFPDEITFADYFSHRQEYTLEINGKWATVVKWEGVKNVSELKDYIRPFYIRFEAEKVLKLGRPVEKDILVSDIPDPGLLAEFESFYENEEEHGAGPTKKALAALKTAPFTVRYVRGLLEEIDCVPIYTDHVEAAKALGEAFGVTHIDGSTGTKTRQRLKEEFQRGKSRVLVATMGAFSTGIDLTRANNLVLNDPPWVPGTYDQTVARIVRRSQTRPCTIHRIFGSPQSAYIFGEVLKKRETIAEVV